MFLSGSGSPIISITTLAKYARGGFILAALLGASLLADAAVCSGTASLQARVQAHADGSAYLALGNWYVANHQTECAQEAFQSALKINPASKAALHGLATAQLSAGDYGAVISSLQSAKRDENLTLDLAYAYRATDQLDDATRVLNEGLKIYPASVELTGALVSLEIHNTALESAQALAEKLARLKPNDLEAQRIYLRMLVINGQYEKAAPLCRKLLAISPHDADLLDKMGYIERQAANYPAARKHLEESVALDSNNYYSRYSLGVVLAQLHDAAGAREQFTKAIELNTSDPEARFELAKVLRTLGENDAAQEQLKMYRQRLKEKADLSQAVEKSTQAEEAVKAGDNRKAADLLREACAILPNNPTLAYRLALVLGDLGDSAGERASLEQAIKADPHFVMAQFALGYLEFQAGDNAEAEQHFRLTVKDAPENARAWLSLAAALATEYKFEEAREAVGSALKLKPDYADAQELSRRLADAPGQR